MQFAPPRVVQPMAPVPVAAPKPAPKETKALAWDFGDEPRMSVPAAVAAAIAKNSVRTEAKTAPKPPVKVGTTHPQVSVHTENLHSHKCARCGTIFQHDETNYGNAQAHMCPRCGYGPNFQVYSRP